MERERARLVLTSLPEFNREGLGTSLEIMGLATIDPHSQKEHTEIHKIPKFRVNQASFD